VKTSKVPTWSFPAYKTEDNMHEATRAALPNAPLVSVHAYAKEDRVTVFLISRKLDNFPVAGDDGYTLATVKLPFAKARKITLHKLAGNPRADDRFEEVHKVETLDIDPNSFAGKLDVNGKTGADPRGLPPASIFCYVFEGAGIGQADPPPVARFELPETIVAGEPASLKGTSGDGLTHAWNFGPAGESSEFNPSVTFPEAGMVEIALTVANAKGLSNTLKRANCPVGVRFGGEVWKPWSNDPGKGKGPRARLETDGTLALIGTSPAAAQGRYSLLRAEPIFGKGFILEAVIAKVEGQGNDPRIAGGLALAANPRVGLGFSFDDLEQLITPASIFVAPDGAVRKLTGQGEQLDELLPAGSLAFPAKLRLAVKDGQAVASVETGGAWKEVATFALPDDIGLMPALAVGSPNGNAKTTMTVSTIKITDDNK
jgi:PKD repeat protein